MIPRRVWFFLAASEAITVLGHDFKLPGIGSYTATAVLRGDTRAVLWAILTMVIMVVLVDQLFWRPIVAWAQRFKFEEAEAGEALVRLDAKPHEGEGMATGDVVNKLHGPDRRRPGPVVIVRGEGRRSAAVGRQHVGTAPDEPGRGQGGLEPEILRGTRQRGQILQRRLLVGRDPRPGDVALFYRIK